MNFYNIRILFYAFVFSLFGSIMNDLLQMYGIKRIHFEDNLGSTIAFILVFYTGQLHERLSTLEKTEKEEAKSHA